jgi:predicted amidophosphoribosyltransferase
VWLLELLFPSRCVACGTSAEVLCAGCRAGLRRVGPPLCALCGAPTLWPVARCRECAGRRLAFSSARAAVAYAGPARALVSAWKEHGLRRAASLAAELVVERMPAPAADVITYIPPDPVRLLERGHHPAERLARELASRWGGQAVPLLARVDAGAGRRQASLDRDERLRNVRGAFTPAGRAPTAVVLVDDVYTTGATASEAAAALRRAGAETVTVVTFARTTRL